MALLKEKSPSGLPPALEGFEGIKRYWDKTNDKYAAKILPGEVYVTTEDEVVTTVLGSCVSACVRDPIFKVGGMNHFMLPLSSGSGSWDSDGGLSTRYGNYAMELLINEILKHGGSRKNLEVKIFGGGKVLSKTMSSNVGERNIHFVEEYLRLEGLKLEAKDVGDIYPRKVLFHPYTGLVRVKKLRNMHNRTVAERETAYMKQIDQQPVSGEIDLF